MKQFPIAAGIHLFVAFLGLAFSQDEEPRKWQTGGRRTPPHLIAEALSTGKATLFKPTKAAVPAQILRIPPRTSPWGNDQYGDCVTAESAAAIAADSIYKLNDEIFVPEANVIAWARKHGVLNGADLLSVIQAMERDGITDEKGVLRKEGIPSVVDFSKQDVLQAALANGPISIAIASGALPSGAGSKTGWYAIKRVNNRNTDHCVCLFGYGPAKVLFEALGVPLPSGVDPNLVCYLLYTWNTIGVVSHDWIMGTTDEAWLRTPTVLGLDPPPPDPVGITITPASATLAPGATQQFVAAMIPAGQDSVVWSASGGGITAAGLYTAPSQVGNYSVKATLLSNSAKFATAPVTVSATPPQPPGPGVVASFTWPDGKKYNIVAEGGSVVPPGFELNKIGTQAKLDAIMSILKQAVDPVPDEFKLKPKEPEKKPEPQPKPDETSRRSPTYHRSFVSAVSPVATVATPRLAGR